MAEAEAEEADGEARCEECSLPVRPPDSSSAQQKGHAPLLHCVRCGHWHHPLCHNVPEPLYRDILKNLRRSGGWICGCEGCGAKYKLPAPADLGSQEERCPLCLTSVDPDSATTLTCHNVNCSGRYSHIFCNGLVIEATIEEES